MPLDVLFIYTTTLVRPLFNYKTKQTAAGYGHVTKNSRGDLLTQTFYTEILAKIWWIIIGTDSYN